MKREPSEKPYFIASIAAHALIVIAFIFNLEMSSPMVVVENTNQHDVISAVVLGDTAKSKILPHEMPTPPPPPKPIEKEMKEAASPPPKPVTDAIALKAEKKLKPLKKITPDIFGKDLLADVAKQTKKVKKQNQKQLTEKFEKLLKQQSEQSLRDHLLDENIKLQGQQSRLSQGVVDKYKALIIQAISEKWVVPPQANKKLSSELLIRLAPGGVVLDVSVTKSSGDPALDSSARAAVLKASPLPVPPDTGAFESFRQFVLKVKPENIMDT